MSDESGWQPWTKPPKPFRRIVALYNDGSGARIYFYAGDGQLFCGEDGCEYDWNDVDNLIQWSYLPAGYRLWVEVCADPMTFPAPTQEPTQ